MQIRLRETGAVMYESELRSYLRENNGPSFNALTPEVMQAIGADPVFEGAQATGGTVYQYSQRDGVEEVDGKWYTKYILGPVFTDTEQEAAYKALKDAEQAASVRADRTKRLGETDWRFRSDMSPSQEWKDYCQALRDITTQAGFPWTVVWPTQPE